MDPALGDDLVRLGRNLRHPEMAEASIDALEASGIRAVFGHGTAKPSAAAGRTPYWEVAQQARLEDTTRPWICGRRTRLMRPSPLAPMSPLFTPAKPPQA